MLGAAGMTVGAAAEAGAPAAAGAPPWFSLDPPDEFPLLPPDGFALNLPRPLVSVKKFTLQFALNLPAHWLA